MHAPPAQRHNRRPAAAQPDVGIRTKATKASDKAWRIAHTTALPWLRTTTRVAWTGTAATIAALLVIAFGGAPVAALALLVGYVAAGLGFAGSVAVLLIGCRRGDQAARAEGRGATSKEGCSGGR